MIVNLSATLTVQHTMTHFVMQTLLCHYDVTIPRRALNMIFIQKKYRDAVVRNWFKVWCALKLLVLARRARHRANQPGGGGACAARASFERASKRQRS